MKKIGLILLSLIIILFSILIGSYEGGLHFLPSCISILLILCYLLCLKIKDKKIIFFKNKFDLLVFLFYISTSLPIIFGTYASLSDSIYFFMRYSFIYFTYVLARNVICNKEDIEIILSIIVLSSLMPVVIGYDVTTSHLFTNLWNTLKVSYVGNNEFSATFGYANTLAMYLLFCILISIHKINIADKMKNKVFYIIHILISLLAIYKSNCRFVWLIIFVLLFYKLLKFIISKYYEKTKIIFGISFVLTIIVVTVVSLSANVSAPIVTTDSVFNKIIAYPVENKNNYILHLDMDAIPGENSDGKFIINIYEINEYSVHIISHTVEVDSVNKKLDISFNPKYNGKKIRIEILNNCNGKIELRKLFINNKEYIMNFKYYSYDIGTLLRYHKTYGDSFSERKHIYNDCMNILSDSPYFGHGGNAWRLLSSSYRSYVYAVKETHSYFFELLISYGFIGTLLFMTMIGYFIYRIKNNKKTIKNNKYLIIALSILFIHSFTFDFNMSFMLIQIIFYTSLAILIYDQKDDNKYLRIIDSIPYIILVLVLFLYSVDTFAQYMVKENKDKTNVVYYNLPYRFNYTIGLVNSNNSSYDEKINNMKYLLKYEPYYFQNNIYPLYLREIKYNIDNLSDEQLEEDFNYLIDCIKHSKRKFAYDTNEIISRANVFDENRLYYIELLKKLDKDKDYNRIKVLSNMINSLSSLLIDEYKVANLEIYNYGRTAKTKEQAAASLMQYYEIVYDVKYCINIK